MSGKKTSMLAHVMRTKPMEVIRAAEVSQELQRSLSLFDLLCIGIGATVGSGIFATCGLMIKDYAGPAAVLSWLVGGIVCCLNALAYMELTTRIPSCGSTYAYAYHAIGELPAVIAAWLLTLEYAVSAVGTGRSWADKVAQWIAESDSTGQYAWLNYEYANLLSFLCQAMSTVVLLVGVRFGKAFVNTVTIIKLFVVAFIVVAGLAAFNADHLQPFIPSAATSPDPSRFGFQGIMTGATQAFFGYVGFDEVCCLAAETKNPKRVMPIAVLGVVLGTTFLSMLCSFVLSGMVPYTIADDFPKGFSYNGMPWAATIVNIGVTVTMPVVSLIGFLAQPRLNYALACDGLLPKIFAKVDASGNLFWNTLITGIFFSIVALVVPFGTLWDLVNFGILVCFVMTNVSLMMMRTRDASPQLAPALIGAIVFFSACAGFGYQLGYVVHGSGVCLVLAMLALAAMTASGVALWLKCPQALGDSSNFSAPLVPLIPTISILANWYLLAQISIEGLGFGVAWVLAAVLSYFLYGYKRSAGRNQWADLMLTSLPKDSCTLKTPMLSRSDVRPSLSSALRD